MARIENTQVYPTVTPAMDDLLIATDVSNNNETVTFTISSLIGGAGVTQGLQSVLDTGNTATQNINLTGNIVVNGTVYPSTVTAAGTTGVAGQILSSTGTGIQWINSPSVSCCGWEDTLTIDPASSVNAVMDAATMTFQNAGAGIIITTPATLSNSGTSTFTGQVNVNSTSINFNATGQINDGSGATGAAGQWLTSTGTGLAWSSVVPSGSCCTLQDTINSGPTSTNQGVSILGTSTWSFAATTGITSAGGNNWSGTNTFSGNGTLITTAGVVLSGTVWAGASVGTAGQVLSSTGTGVQWVNSGSLGVTQNLQSVLDTAPFGATGANANIQISGTLRAGDILDSSGGVGAVGQVLTSNAGTVSWTTPSITAGVSSLTTATGTSSGNPLSLSAATGAITMTSNAFNGAGNIGFVPTSAAVAQTTHFLRADGSWQIPPSTVNTNSQTFKIDLGIVKGNITGADYFTFTPYSASVAYDASAYALSTTALPGAPDSSPPSAEQHMAGIVISNPSTCSSTTPKMQICGAYGTAVQSNATSPMKMLLYKTSLCRTSGGAAPTYAEALSCTISPPDAGQIACCTSPTITGANDTIDANEAFMLVFQTPAITDASYYMKASLHVRIEFIA